MRRIIRNWLLGDGRPAHERVGMHTKPSHRPGDLFLDRYMPDATNEEREAAYENLLGLIQVLVEIDRRLARERREDRDSHESDGGGRVQTSA